MAVAAVSMVKDEADIIAWTLRRMAAQVDFLIVADNGSTDGTREILETLTNEVPLTVRDDREVGYYQSAKTSALAATAAELGAEWVIPFDADELWYSPFGRIGDVLGEQPAAVSRADLYDHVATGEDPDHPDPVARMLWRRREPAHLGKVACRPVLPVQVLQGNHGAAYATEQEAGLLVVRHFPYRSAEQFVRKARNGAAAYAATDLPEDQGAHWRQYGALLAAHGPEALADVFREHFWSLSPGSDRSLIFDPAP